MRTIHKRAALAALLVTISPVTSDASLYGVTFWFRWNTLSGSQARLTSRSLASFSGR